jgi:ubiquinone/menaquinone biosynthesis C-methylase UbiE
MLIKAYDLDHKGDYHLVEDGDLSRFQNDYYDLVLSVFTFDNIPTMAKKVKCFSEMGRVLNNKGRIVNLVSSPLIYTHEWASFTTKAFTENVFARSGDKVKIVMTDVHDQRPVEDILWTDDAYQEVYKQSELQVVKTYRPLGREGEPYKWICETSKSPWVIYILKKKI